MKGHCICRWMLNVDYYQKYSVEVTSSSLFVGCRSFGLLLNWVFENRKQQKSKLCGAEKNYNWISPISKLFPCKFAFQSSSDTSGNKTAL